ncbi:MAG: PAS domain-containing protein [Ginsengibacter sp.]
MKIPQSFESFKEILSDDTAQSNKQIFHGHPELVNFPSTAEVYHAVFENSYHANCIGNNHGKILEANESVCKIFGYTEEEMTSLTEREIFDTTDSNYEKCLAKRESDEKIKAEVTGIRKNGERFLCEVSSVIFTGDNGEKRTINTIHDISKNYIDPLIAEEIMRPGEDIFLVDGNDL